MGHTLRGEVPCSSDVSPSHPSLDGARPDRSKGKKIFSGSKARARSHGSKGVGHGCHASFSRGMGDDLDTVVSYGHN